jgi:ABC-type multidrug transport system fused ATPase/permease subunit
MMSSIEHHLSNDSIVEGNSLERIQSYIDIDHEPQSHQEGKSPAYWPASGTLRVENLSARYSPAGPIVLDNLNFNIFSGERIGVGMHESNTNYTVD